MLKYLNSIITGRKTAEGVDHASVSGCVLQCPPCKFFTPELTKTYERLKETGRKFEVIFVTSDRSLESFQQHVGCMPWLAIPFGDPRLQQFTNQFGIDGKGTGLGVCVRCVL